MKSLRHEVYLVIASIKNVTGKKTDIEDNGYRLRTSPAEDALRTLVRQRANLIAMCSAQVLRH